MTFSTSYDRSTLQHQAIYATERAKVLFGSYRRGDANDPDGYVAAVAAVLAMYEPEMIKRVTDPRTGISTNEKFRAFMPNSGELKAYCDEHQAIADRYKHYASLPTPSFKMLPRPEPQPGSRANLFVPAAAPGYAEMIERARAADPLDWKWDEKGRAGIWVRLDWHDDFRRARGRMNSGLRMMTDADLRALYPQPAPTSEPA
jgi:hypothetical protein